MVKVSLPIQMEIYTMVNGRMINKMVEESYGSIYNIQNMIFKIEIYTKVNGRMVNKMVEENLSIKIEMNT